LGAAAYEQIFQDLVAQAREHGLVKDRLRLKDATHVLANIAIPSTLTLVAQTRDRLLVAARPYAAEQVAEEEAEVVRMRSATADLPDAERLLHRVTHLRTLVAWIEGWFSQVEQEAPEGDASLQRLRDALALAHHVLHDRDHPDAPDKVISVHDSEARWGWHHQWFAGYLLDISEEGFVVNVKRLVKLLEPVAGPTGETVRLGCCEA
jgi:hypothetical protein